jgi:hypothetical protein
MLKRLLQPRWLTAIVILLLAGFAAVYFAGVGIQGSSAATPDKKGAQTDARIENLHQRSASRTKGDDPDDRPALLSPEQAVAIAIKALPAKPAKPPVAAGVAGVAGATPSTSSDGTDAGVRKVDHKVVQGTAVFAVMVGTTEVDVDRQTGKVVSVHVAGK